MIKNKAILAAALSLTFTVVACSSSGTTSTSTGSGGGTTTGDTTSTTATGSGGAGGGPAVPAESCAQPGDKGNENGVGTFCTPGGGECSNFPLAGLCLADVGQTQWMCARIGCKVDADCGSVAHCHLDPAGSACILDKCEAPTSTTSSSSSSGSSSSTGTGG